MKVLLDIKDNKAPFLMELLKSLSYVKAKPISSEKYDLLTGLRESLEEVKLHKKGKVKLKSARTLLNEI